MDNPALWVGGASAVIFVVLIVRGARLIFPDGKLDVAASAIFRSASLLPLFIMVGALLLLGVLAEMFPARPQLITWGMPAVVFVGCIWVLDRGIRAVKSYRRDEATGRRGRHHPWPRRGKSE